jgi:type I restriction enzyme, S subunit
MKVASKISREVIRLKHLFPIQITGAWGKDPVDNQGTICLRAADILTHQISHLTTNLTRRSYSESEISSKALKEGDLIIEKSGGGEKQPVGRIVKFKLDEPSLCSNFLCILRPDQSKVLPHFGAYLLYSLWDCREVEKHIKQTTGIQNLDSSSYLDVHISLPSIDFQKVVSDYLDRETTQIVNLIAAKEQMLTLLEEKRAALINHIFTRGLDPNADLKPSGIAWLGKIPKSWEVRRGKYLFSQSSLSVRETDEIVTCFRDGQVTLRKNRREDGFTNAVLELGYQGIRKGQLILHSMDAFAGSIGISDSDGKCSPEYIICDPLFDGIDSQYYALLLRVMALRGFIQAACTAVRERAPRIRFSHLANMFLPLPPISEQQAIVQAIEQEKDSTKDLVIALTDSIALLKERRSVLITAAVTGQISIQEMSKHSQNEVSQ